MSATDILHAEHEGVLAVLAQLDRAANAAAHGAPVPVDVFTDIGEFFTVFVDRCHHGKEEAVVFGHLAADAGDRLLAERLQEEHDEGRKLARDYRDAVAAYVPGDATSGKRIEAEAKAYEAMLREHIRQEEEALFPVMAQRLAASDEDMAREFDRIEEEEIGPGTHERLHRMIDSLPTRIEPWLASV
jgi:hemerythrin-like domain-containing protein